ncbi:LysR family transcriptional regulator [Stigmatella erecta]|uniref:Transcriptional regulator, LysR family n=1 Tax=Stigmatella erecta TaxID=83460 RepID=A0A1I0K043_9BACT|nr:LysR family transcriptional regulator [Stigmatella erecta]SEU16810.1 transcriptional regulator, LysR family [Stigmatella erecta]
MAFDSRLLDGLGVLHAVVEAGSFVRAGEALGLTQSAVSRAVARIEGRIGVRLFHRTARSIALTDEGRRFYQAVMPHLAAIEDATVEAGSASAKVRGRLRVNVDGAIGHFVLAPRIQPFLDQHPALFVELAVRDRMGDLAGEGFDVCIRFGQPEPSALKCRLLLRSRVLTCASPAYLARHGVPRHPGDLEKAHRCVLLRDPSTGSHFGWEFVRGKKAVPVNVTGQLMVNDTGSMLAACLGGQGIAQPLELYSREYLADGRLVQLLPDWADETFPLYAYHHSPQLMSAKVRAFLDFVTGLVK